LAAQASATELKTKESVEGLLNVLRAQLADAHEQLRGKQEILKAPVSGNQNARKKTTVRQ
jgi:hypothetical protein